MDRARAPPFGLSCAFCLAVSIAGTGAIITSFGVLARIRENPRKQGFASDFGATA